jgi:DNA-binding transcriptional LysR family regulator
MSWTPSEVLVREEQSGSVEALKNLVRSGIGYTLVPELSVSSVPDSPHLRRFAPPPRSPCGR